MHLLRTCQLCLPFFFFLFFKQSILPLGFLSWEIWVAFPRESQLQQSHAPQPLVYAGCYSISSKASNSDVDYKIFYMHTDVNACDGTRGIRVCTESWLWEKNPLPHQGIEPVSAACLPSDLLIEPHPHLSDVMFCTCLVSHYTPAEVLLSVSRCVWPDAMHLSCLLLYKYRSAKGLLNVSNCVWRDNDVMHLSCRWSFYTW